jgi:hypothetical protein
MEDNYGWLEIHEDVFNMDGWRELMDLFFRPEISNQSGKVNMINFGETKYVLGTSPYFDEWDGINEDAPCYECEITDEGELYRFVKKESITI